MVLDCLFVSANPNICVNHFCGEGSLIQQPNQKGYSNDPQKYKGMIEKVNITDANVVELIREKLPAATEANKGLMQANGFEQGKNILNKEYDSKISAGVYSSTDNLNNMGTGILLALRGFQYTAHLYITNSARIYIKTIRSNGEVLKDWTLINNTIT